MIDQLTIERIQSAAHIEEVVSDFITLHRRGVNYVGLCPFHEDKTPSFYVSPAKNICKCFACGEGGTPVHFVMKHEQLSYLDALKFLAKKYGIEVKEKELTDEQKIAQGDRESMFILNSFAQKTFSSILFENLEGKSVGLSYFRERGFREDTIKKFGLGYALEQKDAFSQLAIKSGYKKEYLEKTGLAVTGENNYIADRFRGRVIFPVYSLSGKVVAFGGRILKKDEKLAKYINSPESEIYHKGNELYGIYFARQALVKHDKCFLVEGYTDVISMHQAGIENVVASSGTALTQGQIKLIHRFTNNITVLYDGDAAGIKAALRGINLLLEEGMNVKVVLLPEGEDPDSFARKQNASEFIAYIKEHETDFVRFKAALLLDEAGEDPIKRANLINEVVDTIAIIPEEIIRLVYVKECSKLLEMDERALLRATAKKRKANQEKQPEQSKPVQPETLSPETEPNVLPGENREDELSSLHRLNSVASFFDPYEREILRYVVRYGQYALYWELDETTEMGRAVSVVEHIVRELQQDDLDFVNITYKTVLSEAFDQWTQHAIIPERYLLHHPNPEISRLAVNLVSDKYPLSKIHSRFQQIRLESKQLRESVPYILLVYKEAILKQQIAQINARLKELKAENDFNEIVNLMQQLSELKEAQKIVSKLAGERIVLKM